MIYRDCKDRNSGIAKEGTDRREMEETNKVQNGKQDEREFIPAGKGEDVDCEMKEETWEHVWERCLRWNAWKGAS